MQTRKRSSVFGYSHSLWMCTSNQLTSYVCCSLTNRLVRILNEMSEKSCVLYVFHNRAFIFKICISYETDMVNGKGFDYLL